MKKKASNPIDKKKKPTNPPKEKTDEKAKDKKIVSSPPITARTNLATQSTNNPKSNRNIILTDSSAPITNRKKSEQKYRVDNKIYDDKNINKKQRVFSHSPDKVPKSNNTNQKTLQQKNLTEVKFKNLSKFDNGKYPNDFRFKKEFNEKEGKKENEKNKNGDIKENYDPNLYGFNLYKHVKENLVNKDKVCKDNLTKESYYCLECKISTCKKCSNFNVHKGHPLIPKYLYYSLDETIFNDTFKCLDTLLAENPDYLDNNKLKEQLKQKVNESIDELINRLVEIKNLKLKELDRLFESTDGCLDSLKKKEETIKKDIKNYFEKQKEFYYLQVEDPSEQNMIINNPDYDVLKNLKTESKEGMIQNNRDAYNSTFLINYDLFKNTAFINNEIKNLMNDIQSNRDKYLTEFNINLNQLNEDLEKFSQQFNGIFNFGYLSTEFYKMVSDKINKYNEKIDGMRKYIFDMVNKDGNFDKIEKDNAVSETHIKQRFDNILNYQIKDKDEALTARSKNSRGNNNFHRLSMYLNVGLAAEKLKNNLKSKKSGEKIYDKPEDIKLDKEVLQRYFAYETYNTIHNYFRYKKPKSDLEVIEEEFDEELDVAKPIPGTNEILVFDKKTTTLAKRTVKFDKNKHKYTYFLNGCRSVLVKDMLYIFGGVDKEKNTTKIAYVYYIKTNELKVMPEMQKPHAYHSAQFLDYYKAIIIIGGENCSSCEIYDLNTGLWRVLPDLGVPRAHCNLFLDKFTHTLYTFFGVIGDITENHNYTDVIECLELKKLMLGWCKVEYNNRAEMDFKSGYNKILPISDEMILIYGATNMRDFVKKAAVYIIPKLEIVKIDNKIYNEIKETSKYSRKLSKILSSYI